MFRRVLRDHEERSDADDVFLVNRAVWTSQHDGPFAQRDTLFANQVFPRTGPDFPDRAYEQLVGVLSAWTNVSAATWFYLILGPLVAGLSVWAMWRLLMCLGVRAPAVATGAAALFLVLDGGSHAGLGNFSFVRSWQGKSVLLLIVLPVLMCAGLRWGRHGRGVDLWVMLVSSVAAIGLSSSSLFLVPIAAGISVVAGVCDATESRGVRVGALLIPVAPQALVALGTFIADPQPLLAMPPSGIRSVAYAVGTHGCSVVCLVEGFWFGCGDGSGRCCASPGSSGCCATVRRSIAVAVFTGVLRRPVRARGSAHARLRVRSRVGALACWLVVADTRCRGDCGRHVASAYGATAVCVAHDRAGRHVVESVGW